VLLIGEFEEVSYLSLEGIACVRGFTNFRHALNNR